MRDSDSGSRNIQVPATWLDVVGARVALAGITFLMAFAGCVEQVPQDECRLAEPQKVLQGIATTAPADPGEDGHRDVLRRHPSEDSHFLYWLRVQDKPQASLAAWVSEHRLEGSSSREVGRIDQRWADGAADGTWRFGVLDWPGGQGAAGNIVNFGATIQYGRCTYSSDLEGSLVLGAVSEGSLVEGHGIYLDFTAVDGEGTILATTDSELLEPSPLPETFPLPPHVEEAQREPLKVYVWSLAPEEMTPRYRDAGYVTFPAVLNDVLRSMTTQSARIADSEASKLLPGLENPGLVLLSVHGIADPPCPADLPFCP